MVARNRIEIRGSLAEEEVWSTGITYGPSTTDLLTDPGDLAAWAERVHGLLATIQAASGALFDSLGPGTTCQVTEVNAQYYAASGGIAAAGNFFGELDGTGTTALPPQTAVVFSMRTGMAGRSRRGRNYWPACGASLNSINLRLTSAFHNLLPTAWAGLISDIGTEANPSGAPLIPVVYSPTLDLLTAVSQVQVGDVLDTQRRRRDALVETYLSADVT